MGRITFSPHPHAHRCATTLQSKHAGNDVFYVKGIYQQEQIEAYIKVARQSGADIENEINTIAAIHCELAPTIIDCDDEKKHFCVSVAK